MEKRTQVFITFLFLIVLIAGLYIFTNWFSVITGYFTGESEQDKVAYCLNQQGAEFYFSVYCPDCEKQQSEFGAAFDKITKIDCGNKKENCPNIKEIPAWYIPKSEQKINYGLKTLNELSQLARCEN